MRQQRWVPDTHPNAEFIVQYSDGGRRSSCIRATIDGIEQAEPQAVYDTAVAENRLKNEAAALLVERAPSELLIPVTDADGDPVGVNAKGEQLVQVGGVWMDVAGKPVGPTAKVTPSMAMKAKHAPQWRFGTIDGRLEVFIPFLPATAFETLGAALLEAFGDAVRLVEA